MPFLCFHLSCKNTIFSLYFQTFCYIFRFQLYATDTIKETYKEASISL